MTTLQIDERVIVDADGIFVLEDEMAMFRVDFIRIFAESKPELSDAELEELWNDYVQRFCDLRTKLFVLKDNGLKINSRHHLVRLSNIRTRGGMLMDATQHYQWQSVVSGDTFGIKDDLKRLGFRWDSTDRVWFRPMKDGSIASQASSDNQNNERDIVKGLPLR